jgi:hypothetical protein
MNDKKIIAKNILHILRGYVLTSVKDIESVTNKFIGNGDLFKSVYEECVSF